MTENQLDAVRIDATGLTTELLLGEVLDAFNNDRRATFLCESGLGRIVLQRLRMRLSRLRNSMDKKNLPKQHFRLSARIYPYTNRRGKRMDCLVLERIKTRAHAISESLEGMMKHADNGGNAGTESRGLEW